MPNWCSTNIYIYDDDPKNIDRLWENLEKATSHSNVKNDFGDNWLGNLVDYVGKSWESVECEGLITYMNKTTDTSINIQTESAWFPKLDPIKLMIEKYAPTAKLIYSAEEPWCELYWTNDPCLEDKYILEYTRSECVDEIPFELYDEDELREVIINSLNKVLMEKTTDDLITLFEDELQEDGVYVRQYTLNDI